MGIFLIKCLFFSIFFNAYILCDQIAIIGCGYVGLAMAAVFSASGDNIICVDKDSSKIDRLKKRELPIYEPELAERLFFSPQSQYIKFTAQLNDAGYSKIYYLCVPTPPDIQGNCDRSYLYDAFQEIITMQKGAPAVICVKSTVSPGTNRLLKNYLEQQGVNNIELVYNPEFMREGCALGDICTKNPIVLGSDSSKAMCVVEDFYHKMMSQNTKFITTNFETAEIIKYAWNSFSALRIAYVNELADVCNMYEGAISEVVKALALSEELLPTAVLKPGPGYGGSCFPKDTLAFKKILEANGFSSSLVRQVAESNELHKARLIERILSYFPDRKGAITLLGLSFKANTNDIRSAPSIDIIKALLQHGLHVKAYDPEAMPDMKQYFSSLEYCDSPYEAAANADCIIVLTEWDQIKQLDMMKLAQCCNRKLLIDARNIYDEKQCTELGFTYLNMGEKSYR